MVCDHPRAEAPVFCDAEVWKNGGNRTTRGPKPRFRDAEIWKKGRTVPLFKWVQFQIPRGWHLAPRQLYIYRTILKLSCANFFFLIISFEDWNYRLQMSFKFVRKRNKTSVTVHDSLPLDCTPSGERRGWLLLEHLIRRNLTFEKKRLILAAERTRLHMMWSRRCQLRIVTWRKADEQLS
jgi:hypothetical protein